MKANFSAQLFFDLLVQRQEIIGPTEAQKATGEEPHQT